MLLATVNGLVHNKATAITKPQQVCKTLSQPAAEGRYNAYVTQSVSSRKAGINRFEICLGGIIAALLKYLFNHKPRKFILLAANKQ